MSAYSLGLFLWPTSTFSKALTVRGDALAQVSYTVKVAMPPYQANIYNWIKATGTIKADPSKALPGKPFRKYINLNNKCMELRKVRHCALNLVQALG